MSKTNSASGIGQELANELLQIDTELLTNLEGVEVAYDLDGEEVTFQCVEFEGLNIFYYEVDKIPKFVINCDGEGNDRIRVFEGDNDFPVDATSGAIFLDITKALIAQLEATQDREDGERDKDHSEDGKEEDVEVVNETDDELDRDFEGDGIDGDEEFASNEEGVENPEAARKKTVDNDNVASPEPEESETSPSSSKKNNKPANTPNHSPSNIPPVNKEWLQKLTVDFLIGLDGTEIDYNFDGSTVKIQCVFDAETDTIRYQVGGVPELSVDFIEDENDELVPTLNKDLGTVLVPMDDAIFMDITLALAAQAERNKVTNNNQQNESETPEPQTQENETSTKQQEVEVALTPEEERQFRKLQNKAQLASTLESLADGAYTSQSGTILIKSSNDDESITIDELGVNQDLQRSVYKFKKDLDSAVIGIDKNKSKRGDPAQNGSPIYQSTWTSAAFFVTGDKMRNDDIVADIAKFKDLTPTPNLIDIFKQKLDISNIADYETINIQETKPRSMFSSEQKIKHQFSFDKDTLNKKGAAGSVVQLSNMEILDAIYLVSKSQSQAKDAATIKIEKVPTKVVPPKDQETKPEEVPSKAQSTQSSSQQNNNSSGKPSDSTPVVRKLVTPVRPYQAVPRPALRTATEQSTSSNIFSKTKATIGAPQNIKSADRLERVPPKKMGSETVNYGFPTATKTNVDSRQYLEKTTKLEGLSSRNTRSTIPAPQQNNNSSGTSTSQEIPVVKLNDLQQLRQKKAMEEAASKVATKKDNLLTQPTEEATKPMVVTSAKFTNSAPQQNNNSSNISTSEVKADIPKNMTALRRLRLEKAEAAARATVDNVPPKQLAVAKPNSITVIRSRSDNSNAEAVERLQKVGKNKEGKR